MTDGQEASLTWAANGETGLAGYHVYRIVGETRTRQNAVVVTDTSYVDVGLPDGTYEYEITAADIYGNESGPSNRAGAEIFAPVIEQPASPTATAQIQIEGSNGGAENLVEIFVDTGAGAVSQGTVVADAAGNFVFELPLSLGENRVTARANATFTGMVRRSMGMQPSRRPM